MGPYDVKEIPRQIRVKSCTAAPAPAPMLLPQPLLSLACLHRAIGFRLPALYPTGCLLGPPSDHPPPSCPAQRPPLSSSSSSTSPDLPYNHTLKHVVVHP
eukprot:768221-Hanusia_phi.AAC.10